MGLNPQGVVWLRLRCACLLLHCYHVFPHALTGRLL